MWDTTSSHTIRTPPPRIERGPTVRQTAILPLDHGSIVGGFVDRRQGRASSASSSLADPQSGADPIRTGTSESGAPPAAGYRHRPGGPRVRIERTSRGPQPRVLPLNDRGHGSPKKPGVREAAGAIRTHKARLQGECQIRFRRQRHDRRQSTVEKRGEPRLPQHLVRHVRWRRSRRAVLGSVGLTANPHGEGCNEASGVRCAGARNRTAVSGLTVPGRSLPATPAAESPGFQPGSRRLRRCALADLSYDSRGRGRIRTCDRACATGVKSPVPWTAWLRVRSEPGRI